MKKADRCPYGKQAVITGASSGIGRAVALNMARLGFRVYALSRRDWIPPETDGPGKILVRHCDVNDESSVTDALDGIVHEAGGFGILINCAGFGIAGPVEETSGSEARSQMETNFFGTLRVCRLALPFLRAAGRGLILNTGSVAGYVPIPYQALYSASKAAVDALSLALDAETKRFGTRCVLIQPGDTKTGFTDARIRTQDSGKADSPYNGSYERSVDGMAKSEQNGDTPETVARTYVRMLFRRNPPSRISPGSPLYKLVSLLHRLLPERVFRYIINTLYAS